METPEDWDPRRDGKHGMIWSGAADSAFNAEAGNDAFMLEDVDVH